VILDGGSSRVFFPSDAKLLEDDLENLKVFPCGFLNGECMFADAICFYFYIIPLYIINYIFINDLTST